MKNLTVLMLSACLLAPAVCSAQLQVPGVGQLAMPSKTQLLDQSKQMVQDLTSMKSSGKLTPDQAGKVDTLLPKANALNTELAKPQIETSKLAQLAKDLGDLQKEVASLKGMIK